MFGTRFRRRGGRGVRGKGGGGGAGRPGKTERQQALHEVIAPWARRAVARQHADVFGAPKRAVVDAAVTNKCRRPSARRRSSAVRGCRPAEAPAPGSAAWVRGRGRAAPLAGPQEGGRPRPHEGAPLAPWEKGTSDELRRAPAGDLAKAPGAGGGGPGMCRSPAWADWAGTPSREQGRPRVAAGKGAARRATPEDGEACIA